MTQGSCRAVDLSQVSDEVGEELLEAVRLVEGAQEITPLYLQTALRLLTFLAHQTAE